MPIMTRNSSLRLFTLFTLFTLFAVGSFAKSLLAALRQEGFTEFATFLEGPAGVNARTYPGRLLVYAPTNSAFRRDRLTTQLTRRQYTKQDRDADNFLVPDSFGDMWKRSVPTCQSGVPGPGAVDLMTLLSNPEFVNLPPGHNSSIVQKNMPKGSFPVVLTGLGDVVKVTGLDIPYDNGRIRPVSGLFTLPHLLSETLPYLGADKTLEVLDRTGLIKDLDNRTGITFLAPDDRSIPTDLPDDVLADILRRHTIVGLPVFTSDLNHGDSYQTLGGTTVTVTIQCGDVFIGGACILAGDSIIKNGVVHTVDKLFEAPIVVTKTQVQTVTETATETTEVKTIVATTETTTETAGTTETTTETVEITTPETTTTTETVTPCLDITSSVQTYSEPESTPCTELTSSSVYIPPPPPPPTSTIYTPPPPPPSSTYTPSTLSIYTPPPSPPPSTYTPSTSTSTYTPPPSSSEPESTPCTEESTTSTPSSVYTPPPISSPPPPPSYPTPTPSTYTPSTYSTNSTVSEPESTPCETSEPTLSTPSTAWYYSSTTLVTSQRTTSSPEPTYDSVVVPPPETSEPCTTSASHGEYGGYGEHGEHGEGGDSNWDTSHGGGRPGGY